MNKQDENSVYALPTIKEIKKQRKKYMRENKKYLKKAIKKYCANDVQVLISLFCDYI